MKWATRSTIGGNLAQAAKVIIISTCILLVRSLEGQIPESNLTIKSGMSGNIWNYFFEIGNLACRPSIFKHEMYVTCSW